MSEAERRTEELSAFLDGDLESGPAAELRERLERDPELRAELESLRRTVEAVRNLPAERAPAELRERLAASLSSEAAPALKRGRLVGIGGWVAGVSAVAASLLIAAFLFNGSRQDAPVAGGWKSAAKKQRAKQDEPARQDEFEKAFERAQTETRSLDDRETVAGGTVSVETVAVAKDAARPGAFRGSNSAVPPGRRTPSDPLPPKAPAESAPDSARSALEATGRRQAEGEREEINKLAEKMRKEVKLAERDRAPQPAGEPSTQQEEVKKLAADKAVRNSRLKQQQENALRTLRQDAAAKAGDEAQAAGLVKLDLSLLASA
ncbi:MAG: anti-sigma factor, partial [Planctomycetota bacterium]